MTPSTKSHYSLFIEWCERYKYPMMANAYKHPSLTNHPLPTSLPLRIHLYKLRPRLRDGNTGPHPKARGSRGVIHNPIHPHDIHLQRPLHSRLAHPHNLVLITNA
ncbi:hypothetical protein BCR33DRAFT_715051 [Rhizoclosmatium globosum]|uniref:Uncharacterized protein n=1 Tax=Rhizoclosmatium globosum TaxID=329046 RepID=A0A1Y2CKB9_9FUNG|nr:hypothetical protein BCR33DRAFT_715051 [Rhizoclosmatium globosum]|eukprot:ORY47304.1 hypothetical protein BCR33DRAFT_715051 [Rhizoclosmatium globosum]